MRIYLAGPLFTEAERSWMRELKAKIIDAAARIGADANVRWPWEFVEQEEIAKLGDKAGEEIFRSCVWELEAADMVIALLDGTQVDDGTAFEIGFFYSHRHSNQQPIIGIRTDLRNAGELKNSIVNAMIEHACDHIARSQDEALVFLHSFLLRCSSQESSEGSKDV